MSVAITIQYCLQHVILMGCMETKDENKPPLLLEGELLLEEGSKIAGAKVKIKILDVTHIDAKSVLLAESVEILTIKKKQSTIPFEIFGPAPDPSRSYIVIATITVEKENGDEKTLYRTTQSIPVFRDEYSENAVIPLAKMD